MAAPAESTSRGLSRPDVPPMLWLGGTPGAGKSTLARRLARAEDLPLHPVDAWTYDHASRLGPGAPLDGVLARGAGYAADRFVEAGRDRLPLVVADVRDRGLGLVPALVEGPQLMPEHVTTQAPLAAVWLVATPGRTRRARGARVPPGASRRDLDRVALLVARDAVLTARVSQEAARHGLPVIAVGDEPDWGAVELAVREALADALAVAPRLTAGAPLARQRAFENDVVARQVGAHLEAAGPGALPPFPYSCECGRPGCLEVVPLDPSAFRTIRGLGGVVASAHA